MTVPSPMRVFRGCRQRGFQAGSPYFSDLRVMRKTMREGARQFSCSCRYLSLFKRLGEVGITGFPRVLYVALELPGILPAHDLSKIMFAAQHIYGYLDVGREHRATVDRIVVMGNLDSSDVAEKESAVLAARASSEAVFSAKVLRSGGLSVDEAERLFPAADPIRHHDLS